MNGMAGNADLGTVDWQAFFRVGALVPGGIDVRPTRPHPLSYEHKSPRDTAVSGRVGQLTTGQRDCLRLVYGHMTSKDIARALGISPHTVDMRLRTAMKTLGVASRIDAARALVDSEGGQGELPRQAEAGRQGDRAAETYQSLIYQAPVVAGHAVAGIVTVPASTASDEYATQHSDTRFSPAFGPSASGPPRLAGAPLLHGGAVNGANVVYGASVRPEARREPPDQTTLAGSRPWGARNTLSPGARLAWVAVIAIGSALSFGAILGALEALKKLL